VDGYSSTYATLAEPLMAVEHMVVGVSKNRPDNPSAAERVVCALMCTELCHTLLVVEHKVVESTEYRPHELSAVDKDGNCQVYTGMADT
jgi:hypothetical protein